MLDFLDGNVLLTVFIVITLGTAFGAIPFGPLRFGAAGALFIGLAVGPFVNLPAESLSVFQELGLGLFVYMIGLEAGETFFRDMKEQLGIMVAALISVTAAAATAVVGAGLLGITREVALGVFSGALTSTPSMALAQDQTGSDAPAVGYSLGYPTGVILSIILVAVTIGRTWAAKRDQENPDEKEHRLLRVAVTKDFDYAALAEQYGDQFRLCTIRRDNRTRVAHELAEIRPGDTVVLVATKAALPALVKAMGKRLGTTSVRGNEHLTVQQFRVSNQDIAGNTLGNIPLYAKHKAQVVRIRRGDDFILPTDETSLLYGDIVEMVMPTSRTESVQSYMGDSIQSFSELDWIAAAGGLVFGFLLALIEVPLPGGSSFALGAAAGPLLAGIILGSVGRTGRTAWQLPRTANFTLRQFGLMLFLAAVGLASGPAFAETAFSRQGLVAIVLAALVCLVGAGGFLALAWAMGQSASRSNGAMSGVLGQPAVLQYALENSSDSRIMSGYTATFAIALIYKIVVIPVMLVV
ncbi:aspartate-alanine antiporter-like transporter [Corynebacterium uberis]|uniref:aspartate-alanine antiporter-like transporter n=1 Tax=Corynebacterium TaxID=1716 RepID=UPI001D0A8380|nr:TrkA C-terminal domain-containing protein [Corynebacterium uberis]MCZ9309809.1 antiporter [Corynebacterium sp. c6VSa_13]UDL73607.1 antiporter [Corynebacterium uberis]UDL75513.1 antiporter [Corynebacterium uberis]UDL77726.1 antiporter [Corynebacterium uberis]UDL82142.1 antiporter [Corynebacterium uberis]